MDDLLYSLFKLLDDWSPFFWSERVALPGAADQGVDAAGDAPALRQDTTPESGQRLNVPAQLTFPNR